MNPHSRPVSLLLVILFAFYAAGRIGSSLPSIERPRAAADTPAYVRVSGKPLWGAGFWGSARPPVFPLLLKIAGQDFQKTAALQVVLSTLAWGLLGWLTVRFLRPLWMRPAAFGLILALSLDRHIAGWDAAMLTESLSITFLVLFLACGLWLLQGWRLHTVAAFCTAGLVFAFTRDTNAWLLLMLAGLFVAAVLLRWMPPRTLLLSAVLTGIFLAGNLSANSGGRWVFPLANLIGRRILPDAQAVTYFQSSCGMPVTPGLLDLAGSYANDEDRALLVSPDLREFQEWLVTQGKSCYMRWLVFHPVASVRSAWQEMDDLLAFTKADGFFSKAFDPLLPVRIGGVLYPGQYISWIWWVCSLAALAALIARAWRDNRLWAAFILLSVTSFPHLFLSWHGDAMAAQRHALSVGVQLTLCLWLLVILSVEMIWVQKSAPAAPAGGVD